MTTFCRFKNLKERNIVQSWPGLRNLIKSSGFPSGRLLGPNTRAWTEEEIQAWLDSRPTKKPLLSSSKASA